MNVLPDNSMCHAASFLKTYEEANALSKMYEEANALRKMYEEVERFRKAVEVAAAYDDFRKKQRLLKHLVLLRAPYLAALRGIAATLERRGHGTSRKNRLLLESKTIERLWQTVQLHLRLRTIRAQHPSYLHRVWRITVTHPAIAPPEFA